MTNLVDRPRRILISGGGVAGLTAAYWLERFGFTPVVVERSESGRLGGYGFDFAGTGYDLAEHMGIVERLYPGRIPADEVIWVDRDGRPFARLPRSLIERVAQGPYLGLMHYTLEEALIEAVQDRVEIRYGRSILNLGSGPSGVDVEFTDGSRDSFDLLIGADGVHSTTRGLAFGPEQEYARYLGYHIACYPMPAQDLPDRVRAHHSEPGRQLVVYPTDRPGEQIALFLFQRGDGGPVPRERRLDVLRREFGRMGWVAPRALEAAPESSDLFMDSMTQIVMQRWDRGRVALIGDAAGCMTLVSGQGVSMAMAGAYVLATELRDHADHEAAFARYQARMRPEVQRRQRTAQIFARALVPSTRLGTVAQRHLTRLLLRESFAGLIRRQIDLRSILAPQDLPDTPKNRTRSPRP